MNLPPHVKQFFADRKISENILAVFNVGWDGNRIVYPVFDIGGKKIFCNYRRDPASEVGSKFSYDRGNKVSLYGVHLINDAESVLILEGQNDLLAAWSLGIPAVTSTGGALSFRPEWVPLLAGKDVTICLDSDKAGGEGMAKIFNMIPTAKILFLPEGIKDICELTTSGGSLMKLLKTAKTFYKMEDIESDMNDRIRLFKQTFFHEAMVKMHRKVTKQKINKVRIETDKVLRAKEYDIRSLIPFHIQGKAPCLYHSEKTASMHYYEKTNTCYCFGCGKVADAIDIYRKLNDCSFNEAVAALQ